MPFLPHVYSNQSEEKLQGPRRGSREEQSFTYRAELKNIAWLTPLTNWHSTT